MTREQLLLKAAYQLIKKRYETDHLCDSVLQTTIWDGVESDQFCLMEDIRCVLDDNGIDADEVEELK